MDVWQAVPKHLEERMRSKNVDLRPPPPLSEEEEDEKLAKEPAWYDLKGKIEKVKEATLAAPKGNVAFLVCDIPDEEVISHTCYAAEKCFSLYADVVRRASTTYAGYSVSVKKTAYVIAFQSPLQAVRCAMCIQESLLAVPWPTELTSTPKYAPTWGGHGTVLWAGLRARVALHGGKPEPHLDEITGRVDYAGGVVFKSIRMLSVARGGEVIFGTDIMGPIQPNREALGFPKITNRGLVPLAIIPTVPTILAGAREHFRSDV